MRFVIDEDVSPVIGAVLRAVGHEAELARDVCRGEDDAVVVARCVDTGAILVTLDTNTGMRKALSGAPITALWLPPSLSVVLQAAALLRSLEALERLMRGGARRIEIPGGRGEARRMRGW